MVIDDVFSKAPEQKSQDSSPHLAAPIDRLAAFVGEIPIFVPIVSVFLAPLRHDMAVAQLAASQVEIMYSVGSMLATVFVCWLIYQTTFIYFFGATPGKYFVGLRVVSILDQKKPSLTMSFLRGASLCVEMFFLGFAWLASLSHPQRRVLHDRLSDTYVVTLNPNKAAGPPMILEKQLAKNMQAPGWAIFSLILAFMITRLSAEKREVAIIADLEKSSQLCPAVSEALKNWHSDLTENPSRVAVALALFEAERIDENCLEKEAHFSLWRNQEKDMGYLAQALSHSDDDQLFNDYLGRVCKTREDGDACLLAKDFESPSVEVNRLPASVAGGQTDFMRLHAIRTLHDQRHPIEALKLIDESSGSQNFSEFLTFERLKILWETDRNVEARAVFQMARSQFDQVSRIQISSWMCSSEILNKCGDEAKKICGQFVSEFDKLSAGVESEPVELSYIRAQKCLAPVEMDYVNVSKKLNSGRAHSYLDALEYVSDRKLNEAKKILNVIARQTESDEFQAQALADLVQLSLSGSELESFYEEFLIRTNHLSEPQFAFSLLSKYVSLGEIEKSRQVAQKILVYFPMKTSLRESLLKVPQKNKNLKASNEAL